MRRLCHFISRPHRCTNFIADDSSDTRWDSAVQDAFRGVFRKLEGLRDSFLNWNRARSVGPEEGYAGDVDEWDWERWKKHFSNVDDQEKIVSILKIAVYFSFLGIYTRWLLFPTALGLFVYLIDFGWLQFYVLPAFFIFLITWAVLFFQFWKRKNPALLARWQMDQTPGGAREHKAFEPEWSPFQVSSDQIKKYVYERIKEK